MNSLIIGIIAGAFGAAYFMYGKRQMKMVPMMRLFKGQRLDCSLQRLQIALDHPRVALEFRIAHAFVPEQRERHQTPRAVWYHPHRIVERLAVRQRDHMVQHAERIGRNGRPLSSSPSPMSTANGSSTPTSAT